MGGGIHFDIVKTLEVFTNPDEDPTQIVDKEEVEIPSTLWFGVAESQPPILKSTGGLFFILRIYRCFATSWYASKNLAPENHRVGGITGEVVVSVQAKMEDGSSPTMDSVRHGGSLKPEEVQMSTQAAFCSESPGDEEMTSVKTLVGNLLEDVKDSTPFVPIWIFNFTTLILYQCKDMGPNCDMSRWKRRYQDDASLIMGELASTSEQVEAHLGWTLM